MLRRVLLPLSNWSVCLDYCLIQLIWFQFLPGDTSDIDQAREDKIAEDEDEEDVAMRVDEEEFTERRDLFQEEVGEDLGDDADDAESSDEEVVQKVPAKRKRKGKASVQGKEYVLVCAEVWRLTNRIDRCQRKQRRRQFSKRLD